MIALSSDNPNEEARLLDHLINRYHSNEFILRTPLDIYVREKHGHWSIEPAPSAVIAIYNQPFCDLKLIAEIRKIPDYQWVPVIILVSEKLENLRIKFLQVGVNEVLEKPQRQEKLHELIEILLKKYSSGILLAG